MTQVLSLDERFFFRCANCRLYVGRVKGGDFAQSLSLYACADLLAIHSNGRLLAFVDERSKTLFICLLGGPLGLQEVDRLNDFNAAAYSGLEWDEQRGALLGIFVGSCPTGATRSRYETLWLPEALVA